MSLKTSNLYGKISISDRAVASVCNATIKECYGVVRGKTTQVLTENNRVFLNVGIGLKFGVSPEEVCNSLRSTIKYNVEKYIGMMVAVVNITVLEIL